MPPKPSKQALEIEKRFFERGQTYTAISEAMGITLETTKGAVIRARRRRKKAGQDLKIRGSDPLKSQRKRQRKTKTSDVSVSRTRTRGKSKPKVKRPVGRPRDTVEKEQLTVRIPTESLYRLRRYKLENGGTLGGILSDCIAAYLPDYE